MNFTDYDYDLPAELIAQHPAENRDESRMLVLPEEKDAVAHKKFYDLPDFLEDGAIFISPGTMNKGLDDITHVQVRRAARVAIFQIWAHDSILLHSQHTGFPCLMTANVIGPNAEKT